VSCSVLVVDDDASFRDQATRMLAAWGYVVVGEAGTVEEAVAGTHELCPDVALVDIGLPDGDGLSLARRLGAMPRPPRVVLISTDADATTQSAARRAGASGFLPKDQLPSPAFRQLMDGG